MILSWTAHAWDDYLYWQKHDTKTLKRINQLVKEIQRNPFQGIGDPEPLKHHFSGYWSRRIDRVHRLVYQVTETQLIIVQCRYHYS